jgi:thiol-disulfide isomerase/thioredoxin
VFTVKKNSINKKTKKISIKMKIVFLFLSLLSFFLTTAQTINANLKHHAGQQISLTGFNYYQPIELAKDTIDASGNYTLNYPKDYKGMGVLNTQDNNSLVLMLTEPSIQLKGTHITEADSLVYSNSNNNTLFLNYAKARGIREAAWVALKYLQPLYQDQKELHNQTELASQITKEITRLEQKDTDFIKQLEDNSYLRWFIPMRTLVNEMPKTYNKYTERIPQNIKQFRSIDFKHPNFKTSGLFKDLIEGHYMLLENMGQSLDSSNVQMNLSTKYLVDNLKDNNVLLNDVCGQLYNYFEKRSLFKASEYLSLTLLNDNQCSLNDDLAAKLESYRKLKVGATAPDILFDNNQKLSEIKTNKLLVFGASWCPNCKTEALELSKHYDTWKTKNVEIVYISIDTDKAAFVTAYKNAPWQTHCDYKGWDTQAALDYHITGTPSCFLLDENNTILLRPNNVDHANAWISQKL